MLYNSIAVICLLVHGCYGYEATSTTGIQSTTIRTASEVTTPTTTEAPSTIAASTSEAATVGQVVIPTRVINETPETGSAEGINEENRDANGTAVRAKRYYSSYGDDGYESYNYRSSGSSGGTSDVAFYGFVLLVIVLMVVMCIAVAMRHRDDVDMYQEHMQQHHMHGPNHAAVY